MEKDQNQNQNENIPDKTTSRAVLNESHDIKNNISNRIKDINFNDLLNKLETSKIIVNRLDYYGNSIPLGAFCYAVSFILYGFFESKIYDHPDKFTFSIILLFGGIGQITAGIFEYIKSRTFPTSLYLLYGLYFISFFLAFYYKEQIFDVDDIKKIYFGTWAALSFPIFIGSFQSNLIFLLQNLSACGFFVVRCIGECKDWDKLKTTVSGILELVTGFLSLYICFSQILNEHFKCTILPTIPLQKENEIDINNQK